jgi:hypothetical protein
MELLQNSDQLLKTFWFIAQITTVIFVIQTVLTFVGSDAYDGVEAYSETSIHGADMPFQIFSLRNLINFLLGFSWTGISFYSLIPNAFILITLSILVGASFVYAFFVIMKKIQGLAEDNSFKLTDTIGKSGDVYLKIPGKKSGKGKIIISVNGSVHELSAMTEKESIATGAVVKVVKIESKDILIVETI